jgi:ABC-type multidrug transport system ATPase subunit
LIKKLQEMKQDGFTETKLKLLSNITGAFRPGVLTALVGVSGAGKTTLMDVLAGRKTGGYIEGDIRISGFPKNQKTFSRISGYCEQTDIHSPQVTVRESLIFSAWLRLGREVNAETKMVSRWTRYYSTTSTLNSQLPHFFLLCSQLNLVTISMVSLHVYYR